MVLRSMWFLEPEHTLCTFNIPLISDMVQIFNSTSLSTGDSLLSHNKHTPLVENVVLHECLYLLKLNYVCFLCNTERLEQQLK